MVGRFGFADRSRVVVWFSSHVAQLFSLGSMALFIMLTFFAVSAVAVVFFTDRRDVVFVAPVGDVAQTSFWPIYRHESMVPGFGFVTDCTDRFIHIFMSVHEMLPNKTPEPTGVGALFLFASDFIFLDATGRPWLSFFR